jgi:hypothetical protein
MDTSTCIFGVLNASNSSLPTEKNITYKGSLAHLRKFPFLDGVFEKPG